MSRTGPSEIQPGGRRAACSRAFSLIELILVLALLAMVAALAAPSLSRFARGREALDAAAHLLAVINYAQDRAVNTAEPHRMQFDTTENTYWLEAQHDGNFTRLASEYGRTFSLPQGVTVELTSDTGKPKDSVIEFQPDSGHDVASIRLIEKNGNRIVIAAASPAEPFRISSNSSQEAR